MFVNLGQSSSGGGYDDEIIICNDILNLDWRTHAHSLISAHHDNELWETTRHCYYFPLLIGSTGDTTTDLVIIGQTRRWRQDISADLVGFAE